MPVQRTLAEIMGLEQGLCRGRGGSMHLWDREGGVMTSAIVGGGIPAAGGYALASKLRGTGDVGVASFGDGAMQIGAFHETASLARAWDLPLILLLENNQYSVATNVIETAGFAQLGLRARGYDMPALVVDGMDPIATMEAMRRAREYAVSRGPILLEAITYRYYHQNGPLPGSAFKYRSKEEEQEWRALDPSVAWPRRLVESGLLTQDEVVHVQGLARALVARCVAALTVETPEGTQVPPALYPPLQDTRRGMLGPGLPDLAVDLLDETPSSEGQPITYTEAIQGVIGRALERDPEAFVLGEEVGHLGGGVMGLTRGAVGIAPERVLSTPICENGFTGAALGAALAGMHPIVEFMYPDFVLEATDQLFNHIAKSRYMFGGDHEVPIVVRTQISRGRGYGPQHSTDPAALFATFPGLARGLTDHPGRLRGLLQRGAAVPRSGAGHRRSPPVQDIRPAAGGWLRPCHRHREGTPRAGRLGCHRGVVGLWTAACAGSGGVAVRTGHRGRGHRPALAGPCQLRPGSRAGLVGTDRCPSHRRSLAHVRRPEEA